MILDKLSEFSDSQDCSSATISTGKVSDSVVDTSPAGINLAKALATGYPVWLVVQVDVTGTGTGTLQINLVSDTGATLAAAPVTHYASPAMVSTNLVAGKEIIKMPLPAQGNATSVPGTVPAAQPTYLRYLGLWYISSGTVGALKLSAFLTLDPQANVAYTSGFTVA